MVDDRYAKNQRYINSLSKWVRSDVVHHSNFDQMLCKLEPFVKEMVALDNENRRIAEIEQLAANERQNLLNSNSSNKTKNSFNVQNKGNGWSTNKRKQTIQYESDNSNDGITPNKVFNQKSMDNSANKLKTKMGLQNNKTHPTLGSFQGPKNKSEFFSKGQKNKETPRKSRPGINRKSNKIESNGAKNARNKGQSPSARLALLAGFFVQKEDIIENNICGGAPSFGNTFAQLSNNEHPSSFSQHDNHINVPSDIKIGSNVSSDCALTSAYSTNNSNSMPQAPLSDITPSKNDDSSKNINSGKKKFKFSPANYGAISATLHEAVNVEANLGKNAVTSDANLPNINVNKCKSNTMINTKPLQETCDETPTKSATDHSSTITPTTELDNKLKSNRYVPKPFEKSYLSQYVDSDDDFQ